MNAIKTLKASCRLMIDRDLWLRSVLGIGTLIALRVLPVSALELAIMAVLGTIVVGFDVLAEAIEHAHRGEWFTEYSLMTLATLGALALGEWLEGIAIMLFYLIGEGFQRMATRRSRRSIESLLDLRPDTVRVVRDGGVVTVSAESVVVGDVIEVRPGERIGLDGLVTDGASDVDTQAITGEAVPRSVLPGDAVMSGAIVLTGRLLIEVTHPVLLSTASRILFRVREAERQKAKVERFIRRFARRYTALVVLAACLVIVFGSIAAGSLSIVWVSRALLFLIMSCPCAMVLSIPLTFFAGIGIGARHGVLVKGGVVLETMAAAKRLFLDKTGTLTTGQLTVVGGEAMPPYTLTSLLSLAALAERHATHPVAMAIKTAARDRGCEGRAELVRSFRERPGYGVEACVDGTTVLVGNVRLMHDEGFSVAADDERNAVYIAVDGRYVGCLWLVDTLRSNAKAVVGRLAKRLDEVAVLSGDRTASVKRLAASLGTVAAYGDLLPDDKARMVMAAREQAGRGRVLFVGDGINDAPALAAADVGFAMGGLGQDAAIETADVVLMSDDLHQIEEALDIAHKTRGKARQNLTLAIGGKLLFIVLAALGWVGIWGAIFVDTGLALLTVLNTMTLFLVDTRRSHRLAARKGAG